MLIFFSSKTTFNWIITSSLPFFFCPTGFKNKNKNYSFPYWDDKPLLDTSVQVFRHLGVYQFSRKSCFVHGILITCNYPFYTAKHSLHYSQHKNSISNSPKSNWATNKVDYLVIFFFFSSYAEYRIYVRIRLLFTWFRKKDVDLQGLLNEKYL